MPFEVKIIKKNQNLTKGEQRRISILSTALDILLAKGYSKLSMRGVAKIAGISLGNLQYHFPNRQALVQALLENFIEQTILKIQDQFSIGNSSSEFQMDDIIDIAFQGQGSKDACNAIYEIWALSAHDEEASCILKSYYERYCAMMTGLVQRLNPELPPETAKRKAALLMSLFEGLFAFDFWEESKLPALSEIKDELSTAVKYIIGFH